MPNKYTILFRNEHGATRYCTFTANDANDAVRQFFMTHNSSNIDNNLFCKLANCLILEDLIEIHNTINRFYTITDVIKVSLVEYSNHQNHQNYQKEN